MRCILSGKAGEAGRTVWTHRKRATAVPEGWHGVPGACQHRPWRRFISGCFPACKNSRSYRKPGEFAPADHWWSVTTSGQWHEAVIPMQLCAAAAVLSCNERLWIVIAVHCLCAFHASLVICLLFVALKLNSDCRSCCSIVNRMHRTSAVVAQRLYRRSYVLKIHVLCLLNVILFLLFVLMLLFVVTFWLLQNF